MAFQFPEEDEVEIDILPPIEDDTGIPLEDIQATAELPDGSTVYEVVSEDSGGDSDVLPPEDDFYANLALSLKSPSLSALASRLIDEIKDDMASRDKWEKTIVLAMNYLGLKVEEFRNIPFFQACAAYDTTLATALYRNYSVFKKELLPPAGPVRVEIIGTPTEATEDEADRVKLFMNYYLTELDKDYYPDFDEAILYTIFMGSGFRKVYQDPLTNLPIGRFVKPQDFIVNINTESLLASNRVTQVYYITRKDFLLRQSRGEFVKCTLPENANDEDDEPSSINKKSENLEGLDKGTSENKSLFKMYECHVELDEKDLRSDEDTKRNELPCPYIVTICEALKKVVAIRRNWKEGDPNFKRREYFVQYKFLPGFGLYGIGLAHLVGSNSITLTSVLRQQLDAGTLKNFPGGLKTKSLRAETNDKAIGPAEWHEVETGGMPISDCIMPMPYAEPSQVLAALRTELKQETLSLLAATEEQIPEQGQNTPVGTTLSMIEIATRLQSASLMSMHNSQKYEFKLLFDLFADVLPPEPYPFMVPGKESAIMKQDFSDRINIVPVSDPNVLTSTHRLLRAEAFLKLAQAAPEMHDLREAYRMMYTAMGIDNIDKLLKPVPQPQALDANSENVLLFQNQPIRTAYFQDDDSHILLHRRFVQQVSNNPVFMQTNPMFMMQMESHIQSHYANKVAKQILSQNPMLAQQFNVPEEQLLQIPEIQNQVSLMNAEEAKQQMEQEQLQQMEAQEAQIIPQKVMMADIEQRREAAQLKSQETMARVEADKEISQEKAEVEAFKTQLRFEGDKAKIEAEQEMAEEKNEVDLVIANIRKPQHKAEKPNV
jgi:hypothetical protein